VSALVDAAVTPKCYSFARPLKSLARTTSLTRRVAFS